MCHGSDLTKIPLARVRALGLSNIVEYEDAKKIKEKNIE